MVSDDKSEKHSILETWRKGGYVWGLRGDKEHCDDKGHGEL